MVFVSPMVEAQIASNIIKESINSLEHIYHKIERYRTIDDEEFECILNIFAKLNIRVSHSNPLLHIDCMGIYLRFGRYTRVINLQSYMDMGEEFIRQLIELLSDNSVGDMCDEMVLKYPVGNHPYFVGYLHTILTNKHGISSYRAYDYHIMDMKRGGGFKYNNKRTRIKYLDDEEYHRKYGLTKVSNEIYDEVINWMTERKLI